MTENPNHQNLQAGRTMWVKILDLYGKVTAIVEQQSKKERNLGCGSRSQHGRFVHHACSKMDFHGDLFGPDVRWGVSKHGGHHTKLESLHINLEQLGRLGGVQEGPQLIIRKISSRCSMLGGILRSSDRFVPANAVGMKDNIVRIWFFSWSMIGQCAIEGMGHAVRQFLNDLLFKSPLIVGADGNEIALILVVVVVAIKIGRDAEFLSLVGTLGELHVFEAGKDRSSNRDFVSVRFVWF